MPLSRLHLQAAQPPFEAQYVIMQSQKLRTTADTLIFGTVQHT